MWAVCDGLYGSEFWNRSFTNRDIELGLQNASSNFNLGPDTSSGTDELYGGSGDDTLYLGHGDTGTGGDGADVFTMLATQLKADDLVVLNDLSDDDDVNIFFDKDNEDRVIDLVQNDDGSGTVKVKG